MLNLTPGGPVVVFGGSFDPPTMAHVELPPRAAEMLGASRLIYVPAAVSPHKTEAPPASSTHRLAMLRLVLPEGAEIDTREIDRGGTSFMIDTLHSLRQDIDSGIALRLLIGTDQMAHFDRWHRWQEILDVAPPAVMVRPGVDVQAVLRAIAVRCGAPVADQWSSRMLDLPQLDNSSTRARARVRRVGGAGSDVPHEVEAYIQANQLYGG
ncbi:MAG: nicotinate (nicotinamide) nucleotide adenylyltransferase [Phycisphaerales bacterium]|nr:nicotinate (nicotinamide) nucleotide adenylyltransferase [Phycisphaerales bacterium]